MSDVEDLRAALQKIMEIAEESKDNLGARVIHGIAYRTLYQEGLRTPEFSKKDVTMSFYSYTVLVGLVAGYCPAEDEEEIAETLSRIVTEVRENRHA